MRTIETKIYPFEELNDKAKAHALEARRTAVASETYYADHVISDAMNIARLMGIEVATREERFTLHCSDKPRRTLSHTVPCVYYSGFSSQGDGASFAGEWNAENAVRAEAAVKDYAPKDEKLHAIAQDFECRAKANPRAIASIQQRGDYVHAGSMEINVDIDPDKDRTDDPVGRDLSEEKAITEALRDFANWIYRQLEKEYEYQTSDEALIESMRENNDEFTADGVAVFAV